jgi:molybdate transport system substrate-binding protein
MFLLVSTAACLGGGGEESSTPRTPLTVFAATSLQAAFEEIELAFEGEHEDVDITFSFGSSPALRLRLQTGETADVYATDNVDDMQAAVDAGLTEPSARTFAVSGMTIIVPTSNPGNVHLLPDLAKDSLRLVVVVPDAPAGRYTVRILDTIEEDGGFVPGFREAVLANVVSNEPDETSVMAKVLSETADAGVVYLTDVTPQLARDVSRVEIPLDYNVDVTYQASSTVRGAEPAAAQAFLEFLMSEGAQTILEEHGFRRSN